MSPRPIEFAFRYCPNCGRENPTVGMIPFRCQGCGFCDFFGPVAAVGALVTQGDGRLLMVRRARDPGKGKWGLPGGFVDRDETVEEAMAREVHEETGLRIARSEYLMSYPNSYNYRDVIVPVIDVFYLCEVESGSRVDLDPVELEHYEWVLPDANHLENMAFHSNRLAIEHWLSRP